MVLRRARWKRSCGMEIRDIRSQCRLDSTLPMLQGHQYVRDFVNFHDRRSFDIISAQPASNLPFNAFSNPLIVASSRGGAMPCLAKSW